MTRGFFAVGLTALVASGCSSSTAPKRTPGIAILSGDHQSDTVDAVLAQHLTVVVTTASGQPAAHQTIQFGQAAAVDTTYPPTLVFVEQPGTSSPTALLSETTDGSGKASVIVKLGGIAGPARVPITVAALGYVDTATYTVQAGHVTGAQSWPT